MTAWWSSPPRRWSRRSRSCSRCGSSSSEPALQGNPAMTRLAYVNGRYLPHARAMVHVEDRGYQFADGVYEVIPVHRGRIAEEGPHLDRLGYSLGQLRIAWPVARPVLALILRELVQKNGVENGLVYLQVTRGVAPRDHRFPAAAESSLVITTKRLKP